MANILACQTLGEMSTPSRAEPYAAGNMADSLPEYCSKIQHVEADTSVVSSAWIPATSHPMQLLYPCGSFRTVFNWLISRSRVADSRSSGQEIPLLKEPDGSSSYYNSVPLHFILSRLIPVHTPLLYDPL
jgi:hypothetical protein